MTTQEIVTQNTILRGVVGSTAYGTNLDDQGDRDEMGVFIEPPENVCGLSSIDSYVYRDKPEGVRSEAGDLDLTMYSLRKFCSLASKGNPSILCLLWLPDYLTRTKIGHQLVAMRDNFITRDAGERFLGYLISQKKALTGERSKKVTRPELVEKFGYDTKFAMHALRLGLQGIELLTTRNITLPIREPFRSMLLDVRRGEPGMEEVLHMVDETEDRLRIEIDRCDYHVDLEEVNDFLVESHNYHWSRM